MNTEEDEFRRIEAEALRLKVKPNWFEFRFKEQPMTSVDSVDQDRTALEQQAEPPPEWPLIKNILAEYGLDAIAFVAEFKAAQRPWAGLTDEDWEKVANRKNTVLDTFEQGAVWAAYKLERRNT